jgi:hypothetical protein
MEVGYFAAKTGKHQGGKSPLPYTTKQKEKGQKKQKSCSVEESDPRPWR